MFAFGSFKLYAIIGLGIALAGQQFLYHRLKAAYNISVEQQGRTLEQLSHSEDDNVSLRSALDIQTKQWNAERESHKVQEKEYDRIIKKSNEVIAEFEEFAQKNENEGLQKWRDSHFPLRQFVKWLREQQIGGDVSHNKD